jgi:hypothetical protein
MNYRSRLLPKVEDKVNEVSQNTIGDVGPRGGSPAGLWLR